MVLILDCRVEKTKKKLQMALLKLLEKTKIEQITVSALCNEAKINRSTFYVYYESPEAVFDEMFQVVLNQMLAELQKKIQVSLEDWIQIYLKYARQNKILFKSIHEHSIDYTPIRMMTELINKFLTPNIVKEFQGNQLLYYFWYSGFFGMIKQWLENDCKESDEFLIDILRRSNI